MKAVAILVIATADLALAMPVEDVPGQDIPAPACIKPGHRCTNLPCCGTLMCSYAGPYLGYLVSVFI